MSMWNSRPTLLTFYLLSASECLKPYLDSPGQRGRERDRDPITGSWL